MRGQPTDSAGEQFGTLRYGALGEFLVYGVRSTMTLAARDTSHLINVPGNPPGRSAGKWGEWYPDVLDANGDLSWPSAFRGIGAMPSRHLDMQEDLKLIEESGFVIAASP